MGEPLDETGRPPAGDGREKDSATNGSRPAANAAPLTASRRRIIECQKLAALSQAFVSRDFQEVLHILRVDMPRALYPGRGELHVTFFPCSPEEDRLLLPRSHELCKKFSWSDYVDKAHRKPLPSFPWAKHVVATRKRYVCGDVRADPLFESQDAPLERRGIRSRMVLPVICEEKLLGLLTISSTEVNAFGPRDISLFTRAGDILGIGVAGLTYEEALREKQQLLDTIDRMAGDGMAIIDRDCNILWQNRMSLSASGNAIGKKCYKAFEGREDRCPHCVHPQVFADGKIKEYETIITVWGRPGMPVWVRAAPIRDASGTIVAVLEITRDVTDRKKTEEQLRASRERLRALAGRLQVVREKERARLARKIHDELGHALAALKMDLSWLKKRIRLSSDPDQLPSVQEKIKAMSEAVDRAMASVREASTELRPGLLDDLGLAAALEWQAQAFQRRTGIRCAFTSSPEDLHVDPERAIALFRICEELLTNVTTHAKAKHTKVDLRADGGNVILTVSDDGRGITDEEIASPMSLGILGVRERALGFGGTVDISGKARKGTTVQVRIPLRPSEQHPGVQPGETK